MVPVPRRGVGQRPAAFIDWHGEPVPPAELAAWIRLSCRLYGAGSLAAPADPRGNLKPSRTLLARRLRQDD